MREDRVPVTCTRYARFSHCRHASVIGLDIASESFNRSVPLLHVSE